MSVNVVVTYKDGRIEYLQFAGLCEMLDWQFEVEEKVEIFDVYWTVK